MITETIARLEANKATIGLKLVAGAAQFQAAADTNPTATPAAYVLPLGETPGARQFSGDDIQKFETACAVVLALRNVADPNGGAVQGDLQALRDGIKTALLGWVPAEGFASLSRGRGGLMAFKDGHLWWQDVYTSSFYERKP